MFTTGKCTLVIIQKSASLHGEKVEAINTIMEVKGKVLDCVTKSVGEIIEYIINNNVITTQFFKIFLYKNFIVAEVPIDVLVEPL